MVDPVVPQAENPNIIPDLYMYLELYDSDSNLIEDKIQCLVEVSDGLSKRLRDLGIVRHQSNPSDYANISPAPIEQMAYASAWNFRSLAPLELNELFWPFQAQRNAEMIVAIEIDSMKEGLRSLESMNIKSTSNNGFGATLKENIETSTSVTVVWGKTNSDKEFSLDMYPVAINYFDDMAVLHLVDHRYFTNKLDLDDLGIAVPSTFQPVQVEAAKAFGVRGKAVNGRQIRYSIAPADSDSQSSSEWIPVSMDPSCYSSSTPSGILADNEMLGQLNMPAVIPDFRRNALSSDARESLTNSATSAMYSSSELFDQWYYVVAESHKGNRILAKNSSWPSGSLVPVGTSGITTNYKFKAITDVFWCEDGFVTGIERSDQILDRIDQTAVDAGPIEKFHLGIPQRKYKTCLRLPIDSTALGGSGYDYTMDNSSLDFAQQRLDAAARWLTAFTNYVTCQSSPDNFSGGVAFINIEEDSSLDPIPFGDLTYMAMSNECAYIKFGVWYGGRDSMPLPGRAVGSQLPNVPQAPQSFVQDAPEGQEQTPPSEGNPVLSAQCRFVPYREDVFNYSIPFCFDLGADAGYDNGSITHVIATADDTTTQPVCTVTNYINSSNDYGSSPTTAPPTSSFKIKIGTPMFLAPSSNAKILAMRASVNANSTQTGAWIALEQEC